MFTQSASDTLGLAQLDLAQIPRQITCDGSDLRWQ